MMMIDEGDSSSGGGHKGTCIMDIRTKEGIATELRSGRTENSSMRGLSRAYVHPQAS
jgi:hypothetical protein